MSDEIHATSMGLTGNELHLLVTWGYAIRDLSGEKFSKREADLLERLKGHRGRVKSEENPNDPLMWS